MSKRRSSGRPEAPPVAVGGVGGSGTRLGAALLRILGYSIGRDLNESLDNLWFTLLFKRQSVLLESDEDFGELARLFFANMTGPCAISDRNMDRLRRLAEEPRLQHTQSWLRARLESFIAGAQEPRHDAPWAWKEPNTHVVIERFFACEERLRYVHFIRQPLDMVLSENQNQLQMWGPIFLNRDVTVAPGHALAYWCEVQRRIAAFVARWPGRAILVDFDAICDDPERACRRLAAFLERTLTDSMAAEFRSLVMPPASVGRGKRLDLRLFDKADLAYVEGLGYDVGR